MDFVSKRQLSHVSHMTHGSQAVSPMTNSVASNFDPHALAHPPSTTSFPITAIIVIGIISSSFLLVSYYILVIKCCLNWHRIDLVRRFSLSMRSEEPSPASEARGLDEAVIRKIPVIHYKAVEGGEDTEFGEKNLCCECAVCLNEFQDDEKLRIIPNCSHVFHIECIDVWLQNNDNCPLCRTHISLTSQSHVDHQLLTPSPSPQDQSPHAENLTGGNEDFVVIDLGNEHDRDQNLQARQERGNRLEQRIVQKKTSKLNKVTSMGDECTGIIRAKDEQFFVQPIKRSFSMDSPGNTKFYSAVQEALQQQNGHFNDVGSIEAIDGSGRVKRSRFSFGHGSRSRSCVLPVYLDP